MSDALKSSQQLQKPPASLTPSELCLRLSAVNGCMTSLLVATYSLRRSYAELLILRLLIAESRILVIKHSRMLLTTLRLNMS